MKHTALQLSITGKLRGQGQVHSVLDDIPGIGPARRKDLMRSISGIWMQ